MFPDAVNVTLRHGIPINFHEVTSKESLETYTWISYITNSNDHLHNIIKYWSLTTYFTDAYNTNTLTL